MLTFRWHRVTEGSNFFGHNKNESRVQDDAIVISSVVVAGGRVNNFCALRSFQLHFLYNTQGTPPVSRSRLDSPFSTKKE
jgi:hypothetical protein